MHGRLSICAFATLAVLSAIGCSTPTEVFLHQRHREDFALQPKELEKLQFYISREVLARNTDPADANTPQSVIILKEGTPGVVLDTGPTWLRVSFQQGGKGIFFVTVPERESAYWLATKLEDGQLAAMRDQPTRLLSDGIDTYRVVFGSNARLLVNGKELQRLIATRTTLQGREPAKR
jgi:hypothetical protein